MTNRWAVLALLFAVRTGMGVQFQAVPALAPLFMNQYGVTIADIGLMIGLYHAPGILLAIPGGAIGQRFGDKPTVLAGLAMMFAGGLMMALLPTWPMQVAGRLVAAVGSILITVLMSKMITDWFAGQELATAMGIFVNSWPFGIAVGLVVLPWLATAGGLTLALAVVAIYLALGLAALALFYQPPAGANAAAAMSAKTWPTGWALLAVLAAGSCWGAYNGALGMIFGFGPLMLVERGFSMTAASATTSLVLWFIALSVPLGGILADRTGYRRTVLIGGFIAFASALAVAPRVDQVAGAFAVLGLVGGLSAGVIMSLPSQVLAPATRAVGMAIFFTANYVFFFGAPWLAGQLAQAFGHAAIAFDFGVALIVFCLLAYLLFVACAAQWHARQEPQPAVA